MLPARLGRVALTGALSGVAALTLAGTLSPATAMPVTEAAQVCVDPHAGEPATSAAARGFGGDQRSDHRDISPQEQRAIEQRTREILQEKRQGGGGAGSGAFAGATVPVYVHVMRDKAGNGDVTDAQIAAQIDVLNTTYGGRESATAANTGFTFTLAGIDRFNNDQWHKDRQSTSYRSQTRQGGANALNMWLVDFSYLGIATFPWDYSKSPSVDGIRVHFDSLPGGGIANYNLGETATHEAGHWLGLYHTFQGGCTSTNDEVEDTPAQSSSTNGCPEGRDSCSLPGLDPIHNYMDYSYDSCYTEFTGGQATRMGSMWTAYRS